MKKYLAILCFIFLFAPNMALASGLSATDVGSDMVTKGVEGVFIAIADNMYGAFQNNTAINEQFGTTRGALFTFITHVPDPYSIPEVKGLYQNYYYLAVFFVIIFVIGELINRNLARAKITENVFGEKDLSTSKFIGGLTICGLALFANLIYEMALKITEALSQYAMFQVMDSIAPDPSNFVTYVGMAICDLSVMIFFLVRYFVLIAFAVCCTIVAVLWVPEATRGFAKKVTQSILRILALQPVTIFATSIGIMGLKYLPPEAQGIGYIGLTVYIFITCWYLLTGDFEMIKKGGKAIMAVIVA